MFLKEPTYEHGTPNKIGVLLINLGTPQAPTAKALRPYLKQFLSDPRIVELPRLLWWGILNGIILNTRPKKSAKKYASIWTEDGSPLYAMTKSQIERLRLEFDDSEVFIDFAMRYGQPTVESRIMAMKAKNVDRILVIPLYPQYAASSTASALDAVFAACQKIRNVPALRTIKHFHDHPLYIDAMAQHIQAHWAQYGKSKKLLLSFHGTPKISLKQGDPYYCECQKTGRLLATELNLSQDEYIITFQSRFGKAEWLQPYTDKMLQALGEEKLESIDVFCPGFVSDCLETREEIAQEGEKTFKEAGGQTFHYIPCLNNKKYFIQFLANLIKNNTDNWM